WLVEPHREAVMLGEASRQATERHLAGSLLHPDLLMNAHVAGAGFVGHSGVGRQDDLDDLDGRGKVGRREVTTHVTRLRIAPRCPVAAPGHRAGGRARVLEERRQGHAESGGDLLQHDRRRAAFPPLDQRDHRAADVALRRQRVEGHPETRSQRPDAARDAGLEVRRGGRRATLLPAAGARAYGMLYTVTHAELERLYTAPGLEQYRPEAVLAQPLEGAAIPALCYNLREAPQPHERNPDYAARLQRALGKL